MKFTELFILPMLTILLLAGLSYGQCDVYDDFSGTIINTSIWNVVSGSWSQNDQLTGYWSISAAQTDQGNILLVDELQPGDDYTVEVDEVVGPFGQYKNGHRYVLYHSPGNKYNMQFGCENASFGMEYRQGGSNYHTIVSMFGIPYFNTTPGQVNHTKLARTGNHFQCYLNDHLIYEFDETIFGGDVKIGLGCYGTATYDNFCLTTGGQPPQPESRIFGHVVFESEGLEGATVYLRGENCSTYVVTGPDGEYTFNDVPYGPYEIWPLLFGYSFFPSKRMVNVSSDEHEVDPFLSVKTSNEDSLLLMRTWNYYKNTRVNDPANPGRVKSGGGSCAEYNNCSDWENWTCSEAQSYLMLRALWMDDQPMFDRAWNWTMAHLQRLDNFLFSWLWNKTDGIKDSNTATDADIDIALALALASKKEKWVSTDIYETEALRIIQGIQDNEVTPKKVKVHGIDAPIWILTYGYPYGYNPKTDSLEFDPSYFSPHAYKIFDTIETVEWRKERWKELVCDTYKLLSDVTRCPLTKSDGDTSGFGVLPPFWVILDEKGEYSVRQNQAGRCGSLYEWDAFRTFWRIAMDYVWHGDRKALTYLEKTPFLMAKYIEHNLKSRYEHDGTNPQWNPGEDYFYTSPMCQFMVTDRHPFAQDIYLTRFFTNGEKWPLPISQYYGSNWMWFGAAFFTGISNVIPDEYKMNLQCDCGDCYTERLEFLLGCPADLIVNGPNGLIISKSDTSSVWGSYREIDIDTLGNKQDYVAIDSVEEGIYQIQVVPENGADFNVTFSLLVRWQGDVDTLANQIAIRDIPENGYYFNTYPFASFSGFVMVDSAQGLLGVNVDIYDSVGTLRQSVVTDDSGYYHIDSIPNGNYTATVVTPIGYQAEQETKEFTIHHAPVIVNFNLSKLDIAPHQRSMGYWKHQVNVHLSGKGNAQESLADMSNYMGLVGQHFSNNLANPITIFEVPQPATQTDSLEALQDLLTVNVDGTMNDRAKQQLIALMLNVVSLKLHQTTPISEDNATVSQAITYCNQLITDSDPSNDETAKDIADQINNGILLVSGTIPLTTPDIIYKGTEDQIAETSNLPEEFSLEQNYPNPFNPTCEIAYALPTDCQVTLRIYNILGQKVRVLVDGYQDAGHKSVKWDGKDDQGQEVTSGVYFYRIQAGDFVQSKKMILMK